MIGSYTLDLFLLKIVNAGLSLEEGEIPEIHLINLTDWGWVIFFLVATLIIWGLIVFQSNSRGSHQYGDLSDSEITHESNNH